MDNPLIQSALPYVKKKSKKPMKKNPTTPQKVEGGGWKAVFGCTYQGLAFFRITLGILLTAELVLRFRFLRVFYTDEGTKPLRLLLPKIDDLYYWICYHCWFGSLQAQQILLGIQVLVAISFAVGYHTRFINIASFYMYTSLVLRNTWLYFILDRYFYYLLFYSIFLPVGKYWSVDERRLRKQHIQEINTNDIFVNPATVALKLLVLWIYIDAGVGKYLDPKQGWTLSADPLPALDTYARHTVFSQHLYGLLGPEGLRLMTPVVMYLEISCVPVAFLASYFGKPSIVKLVIATMCSLHFGISLSIRNSNLLSYVACCAWLVFLPQDDNTVGASSTTTTSETLSVTKKLGSITTLVFVSAMVGGNIWFETIATGCSTESLRLIWSTLLQNRWNVFIGAEEYVTWEIAPGRLADGSIVDVWGRSEEVNWKMPGSGAPCTSTARPGRWRSFPYLADLEGEDADALWGYLCKEWNRENDVDGTNPGRRLLRYNFFMLQADVLPEMGFSETRKRLIRSYECDAATSANIENENDKNSGTGNASASSVQEEL